MRVLVDMEIFMQNDRFIILLLRARELGRHGDDEPRPFAIFISSCIQAGVSALGIGNKIMPPVLIIPEADGRILPFPEWREKSKGEGRENRAHSKPAAKLPEGVKEGGRTSH
jgi:hypothetical protein